MRRSVAAGEPWLIGLLLAGVVGWYVLIARFAPKPPIPIIRRRCTVADRHGTVNLDPTRSPTPPPSPRSGSGAACPTRPIVVALATAMQESKLENLDRRRPRLGRPVPAAAEPGLGHARSKIADPRYAADKFYTPLLKVKGWQEHAGHRGGPAGPAQRLPGGVRAVGR